MSAVVVGGPCSVHVTLVLAFYTKEREEMKNWLNFSLAHGGRFLMRCVGMEIAGQFAAGRGMSDSFGLGS